MRVVVTDWYEGGHPRVFEGDEPEVRADILHNYPFLAKKFGWQAPVDLLVRELDRTQAHSAHVDGGDLILKSDISAGVNADVVADMVGAHDELAAAAEAAAFLAGQPVPSRDALRMAMLQRDENVEEAALAAVGLPVDDQYRAALKAVMTASLAKAEVEVEKPTEKLPEEVVSTTPGGERFAQLVRDAIKEKQLFPVKLGGKHSSGSLLAYSPKDQVRILLKPGSGHQNPAAGEHDLSASQAKREAAFYALAESLGLQEALPEAHLLLLDGQEYAAMKLLGMDYKNMNRLKSADAGAPRRLLHIYIADGTAHRWAALDYIGGNADRNAGNVMSRGHEVKLIDHGSAFAGDNFAPATDLATFVPYYLRAAAPADFAQLDPVKKLHALPRLSPQRDVELANWLHKLDEKAIGDRLVRFGIDPGPTLRRLHDLKSAASTTPASLAVNAAWVIP